MSTQHRTVLGLVGLPGLATVLNQIGFSVIGGADDVREDVRPVREQLSISPMPVLVGNPEHTIAGMIGFVTSTAPIAPVLLVNFGTDGPITHAKAMPFTLPETVGTLVRTLNRALPPESRMVCPAHLIDTEIGADGQVATPVPSAPADEGASPWDAFGDYDDPTSPAAAVPEPTVAPEPVHVEPTPTATVHAEKVVDPEPVAAQAATPAPPAWMANPNPVAPVAETAAPRAAAINTPAAQTELFSTGTEHRRTQGANVIIVTAGDGGATKTTTSRLLAQRAGEAGIRTVLIDGNGGQGDQRKILRIEPQALPSMYDYAVGACTAREVICAPDTVNANRIGAARLDPVSFAVVLAPPADLADHSIVTPNKYREILEEARQVADLIVIDTEKVEVPDMRDGIQSFASQLIIPEARNNGAWILGVFDLDKAALENVVDILTSIRDHGVNPTHTLTMATLVGANYDFNASDFEPSFRGLATVVGHTRHSEEMSGLISAGRIEPQHESVASGINAVLHRITGRSEFEPVGPQTPAGGFMNRLFGRKGN